jgi:hypothetical protein
MFAIVLGKSFTKPFALRQMQRFDPPDHAVLNFVFWSFEFVSARPGATAIKLTLVRVK